MLAHQGDVPAARESFQQAAQLGNRNQEAKSAYNLALLLAGQGDVEAAKDAFRRVAATRHSHYAPMAWASLSLLLAGQGNLEDSQAAYQRAVEKDPSRYAASKDIEIEKGRFSGIYGQGFVQWDPLTGQCLQTFQFAGRKRFGEAISSDESRRQALMALEVAIQSSKPDEAAKAAYNLAVLLARTGQLKKATEAFQRVINSGDERYSPMAGLNLGLILVQRWQENSLYPSQRPEGNDIEIAVRAFQRTIDSRDHLFAPRRALIFSP